MSETVATTKQMADAVAAGMNAMVAKAIGPLLDRIAELEKSLAAVMAAPARDGRDGRDGKDGASPDPVDVATKAAALIDLDSLAKAAAGHVPAPVSGQDGRDGKDGSDAPAVDVAEVAEKAARLVNVGEIAKVAALLVPAPADGRDGIDGKNAPEVNVELVVDKVLKLMPAPRDPIDGKDGKDGLDGKDGQHGRDAADLDIKGGIDFAKHYPRGTFAKHAGGLWRAYQDTDLARGWECIQCGIADIEFVQDEHDFRKQTLIAVLSDGTRKEFQIRNDSPLHLGTYKAGEEYVRGDEVVFGGSSWIATRKTTDAPGTQSDAWMVAARKGRDGKDGDKGDPGLKGDPGRAGRDLTQMGPRGEKWG